MPGFRSVQQFLDALAKPLPVGVFDLEMESVMHQCTLRYRHSIAAALDQPEGMIVRAITGRVW